MSDVKAMCGRLEAGFASLTQAVAALAQNVGGLQQEVVGLQQNVGALQRDVGGLRQNVGALQRDVGGLQQGSGSLQQGFTRIETLLIATLPHLATKAELAEFRGETRAEFGNLRAEIAEKPSNTYLWGGLAALLAAFAAGLAALAILK